MDKKKKEDDTFVFHSPFELNDNRLPGQIVQERLRVNWYGLHKFSPNMSITHFNRSTTNQSFMIRKGREVSRRRSSETPKVRSFYKTLTSRILTYEEINLGIEARIKEMETYSHWFWGERRDESRRIGIAFLPSASISA